MIQNNTQSIEITVKEIKIDHNLRYYIDIGNNLVLVAGFRGFKKPKLVIKELTRNILVMDDTMYFDNLEDAEFVAREYLASKNVKKIKKAFCLIYN